MFGVRSAIRRTAYDEPVLNPLTLPQAVIDGLAVLPALLKEAQAANRTLTEALERADRINAQADRLIAQADWSRSRSCARTRRWS